MARYKAYDLNQTKMIPLSYADQIVEGSFEHALCEIVEQQLDLSAFEKRYANDETGRPAYDPKLLLKIVLYGYYKGILSSPDAGRGVPAKRSFHGAFGRRPAALHDAGGLRPGARSRDRGAV